MFNKNILAAALAAVFAVTAPAGFAADNDVMQDRQDLRQDTRDIREDRRDGHDQRELHKDKKERQENKS